ncbi:DUF2029 domain-containing protein [bacterium]|nr:DUF2029 domain-containing protein [bacterium]
MSDIRDRALQLTYWLSIAFCICTVIWTQIVPLTQALSDGQLVYGEYGTNDFIEYWSAWHAYAAGLNPYDPYVMQATQRLVDPSIDVPLMMWNPPWILTLFSPILSLSFSTAAILWLIVNFLIYLIAVRLYSNDKDALLLSLLFAPFWHSMFVGQLGSFLALGAACIYRGLISRISILIAVGILFLSLKPHFCIPLAIFIFWKEFFHGDKAIVARTGLILLLMLLIICTHMIELLQAWNQAINSATAIALVPHPKAWLSLTLVSYMRSIIPEICDVYLQRIYPIIPFICGLLLIIFNYYTARLENNIKTFSLILFLVITNAPLAWVFDYAIIAPLAVRWLENNNKTRFQSILILLIQVYLFYVITQQPQEHHNLCWLVISIYVFIIYKYQCCMRNFKK